MQIEDVLVAISGDAAGLFDDLGDFDPDWVGDVGGAFDDDDGS